MIDDDWVMGSLADRYSYNFPIESAPREAEPNQWAPGALAQQDAYTPTTKDPWKAMDAAQVSRDIVPERNMPLGVTTPQEEAVAAPQRAAPIMAAVKGAATIPKDMIEGSQRATRNGLDNSEYNPAPAVELMQLLYGVNSPFTKVGAAGAFGGRLGRTADLDAYNETRELLKKGYHSDDILPQTGWRKDIDNRLKYEFTDHDSRFIPSGYINAFDKPVKLGEAFHWPEAYKAYPELAETKFQIIGDANAGSSGFVSKGSYTGPDYGYPASIVISPGPKLQMHETVLHEGGHGIQDLENFATGGNTAMQKLEPGNAAWRIYSEEILPHFIGGTKPTGIPHLEKNWDAILSHTDDPTKQIGYLKDFAKFEAYRRMAGEAEARNIPNRMWLTPDERIIKPPKETLDVPYHSQSVLFPRKPTGPTGHVFSEEAPTVRPVMGSVAAMPGIGHNKPPAPFPQYTHEYPPVGPGEPSLDPKSGKAFMGKVNTPEALEFEKARNKIQADMDKHGYEPYFDPSKRFHGDISKHPDMIDTEQVLPKKMDTILKWTHELDTPETRQALQNMYKTGQQVPNAENWYMMGQLERGYIDELGPVAGRMKFRTDFAGAMAATTGGADPTANFLMAHYGNFMRNKGRDFPRWTAEENQQVKDFSEAAGKPYIDAKKNPIDKTGDIASFKIPYPVGGQYASGNLGMYKNVFDEVAKGTDIAQALKDSNPKRLDFMQALIGNPASFTWDKQMTAGATAGKYDMPPGGAYGVMEKMAREEARKAGVYPANFQDVGWAGQKAGIEGAKPISSKIHGPRGLHTFQYEGPMIGHVNEAIERTHRLTGMPKDEIFKRGIIRGEIPIYGLGGLIAGGAAMGDLMRQKDDEQ